MTPISDKQIKRMVENLEKPLTKTGHAQKQAQNVRQPPLDKAHEPFNKHRYSGW